MELKLIHQNLKFMREFIFSSALIALVNPKVESHCQIYSAGSVTQNILSSCCGTCIPCHCMGVILILVACLGIKGVTFVSVTIGIYLNTQIIKASGREQMILLLVGIALSYLCSVFFFCYQAFNHNLHISKD